MTTPTTTTTYYLETPMIQQQFTPVSLASSHSMYGIRAKHAFRKRLTITAFPNRYGFLMLFLMEKLIVLPPITSYILNTHKTIARCPSFLFTHAYGLSRRGPGAHMLRSNTGSN
jgi:hypothetical protein